MKSFRRLSVLLILVSALFHGGCGTSATSVDGAWSAPDLATVSFKKLMVVAATPDGVIRRSAEDAIKAQILKGEAVTSYSLLGDGMLLTETDRLLAALKSAGCDGVIVVRLVSARTDVTASFHGAAPEPYRMFRSYYSRQVALSPFYYDSTRISTDRIVQLETNIYQVSDERLVWSGVTSTRNPATVEDLIKEAADAIRGVLSKTVR